MTLQRRSLRFYWRAQLATGLCAAVAATVLTGSLLVGDSMRASLRARALERLGPVEQALRGPRFFRADLAGELATDSGFTARFGAACPVILAGGSIELADHSTRCGRINVFGVDERFWRCLWRSSNAGAAALAPGSVMVNQALAQDLGARAGEDGLLRLGAQAATPAETLLGHADQATVSLRLTIAQVLPDEGPGELDLNLTQDQPRNAFVTLADLQRALKQRGRANAILVTGQDGRAEAADDSAALQTLLASKMRLADAGLKLRTDQKVPAVVLESESLLIPPAMETTATAAATDLHAPAMPVLTYLANTMAVMPADGSREVPYSTVCGLGGNTDGSWPGLTLIDGSPAPIPRPREMLLDVWVAEDLGVKAGDRVRMAWYTSEAFHRLDTADAVFTVRGIVRMEGLATDPTLAPEYEGITNAKRLTDWNPPFPVDMKRIRDRDEAYWERYGPTPKAFVSLPTAQELWTAGQSRFGRITSIRLGAAPGQSLEVTTAEFEQALLRHLTPAAAGLTFEPLKARALAASRGNTDFGTLFLAFSIFLIASAAMLTALLFRLAAQRRAAEIGLLLAVGWRRRAVTRQLLLEAVWPAGLGAALGLLGAAGYSALMLRGLRGWWAGAVQADFLRLHAGAGTLLIGWAASLIVAMLSMAWSIRGLCRQSPRELLAGGREEAARRHAPRRVHLSGIVGMIAGLAACLLVGLAAVERMPPAPAFFGGGAALLVTFLAGLQSWTRSPRRGVIRAGGMAGLARLGIRNAARNPLRTLLTAGLVASAAFVITAVGANREDADLSDGIESGTGGFDLVAETTVPILQDLNSPTGRRALGLSPECQAALAAARVMPFRLRPGDEASCAGLYQPTQPRILGATPAMTSRGGFRFSSTVAQAAQEQADPWLLLERTFPDGAVPAIGDESTVRWLLHLGLGDDLVMPDEHGQPTRLRIVGLLAGSALQSELVIAETRFVEHFPSIGGYGFFLIETHGQGDAQLRQMLERDLSRYGLEVTPMARRLARYLAVENAYLTAFQTLGGLGMVLGTLGLGAVLWRTVLDRRGELALLAGLGYRAAQLRWLVLTEHVAILAFGLFAGAAAALVAVTPQIALHPHGIPWVSLGLTLLAVLAAGVLATGLAIRPAMRGRLLVSLRNE